MLLPVPVYLIILFDLIDVPLSLLDHFILRCGVLFALVLVLVFLSGLSCAAYMVAFLPQPAKKGIFLALCILCVVVFCLFRFCLSFVSWFSLVSPFLATMSFAGYFDARFLMSAFFPVCLFLFCFLRPCSFPV